MKKPLKKKILRDRHGNIVIAPRYPLNMWTCFNHFLGSWVVGTENPPVLLTGIYDQ